jgi:hypothetical protein|tara:strand:- start:937 stop:1185 length:249 start_codon:yes stop_codon:yes gene_type:complete
MVALRRHLLRPTKEKDMAKYQKEAAVLDLFDNGATSQPGERQIDLEDLITEKSLLSLIQANNDSGADQWCAAAKAGQVMRIM